MRRYIRWHGVCGTVAALGMALGIAFVARAAPPSPSRTYPIVSLTFDDSHASHAWVADVLAQRRMVATFYVNSPRIDAEEDYLRAVDLHAMEAQGHEIGGHTLSHRKLAELDESEKIREVCDDREALLALGLNVRAFAYPSNSYDAETFRIVEDCGYLSARAAAGLTAPRYCQDCPTEETLPPPRFYRLRTYPSYKQEMGVQALVDAIEVADDDGWLIFVFHNVCEEGCKPYSIHRDDFLALVEWMDRHRVRTRTVTSVILGEEPCEDGDGDGVCDEEDNCPGDANPDQEDADEDGIGDACDLCPFDPANDADADGVCDGADNCPDLPNPDQADADGDGIGDACDEPEEPEVPEEPVDEPDPPGPEPEPEAPHPPRRTRPSSRRASGCASADAESASLAFLVPALLALLRRRRRP